MAPLALVALSALACAGPEVGSTEAAARAVSTAVRFDPPAEVGAFAPNLAVTGGTLMATWLEPANLESDSEGHRLRFSTLHEGSWTAPVSIAEGTDFFANWADFPAVVANADGVLYAHWLAKTADDTYAYSIFLARSSDGGQSWEPIGKLNSDDTPTEHGFVTFVREDPDVRAFWLDGRGMLEDRPMNLRTRLLEGPDTEETILDDRVCECCGTDSTLTDQGPLVVYRDRSESEVRDIGVVRQVEGNWTAPTTAYDDEWEIAGCPVNGPVADAAGNEVAAAWFTSAGDRARVQVAFSNDAGASFEAPIVLDEGRPLGRVDLAYDASGTAFVTWMGISGERAEIKLQAVGPEGARGEARVMAETSLARASGFPILERVGERFYLAWVEIAEDRASSRIRLLQI